MGRSFLVVLQQCTLHIVEIADQISMKFGIDVIFLTGSCRIIPLCLPGGASGSRTDDSRWASRTFLVYLREKTLLMLFLSPLQTS